MSIIEIKTAFKISNIFKKGKSYSNSEIKDFLHGIDNAGHDNPTALTYNQWNCGMPFICPLFEKVARGTYKYLGPDYPYTGDVYHSFKGRESQIVATWLNGDFEFADQNVNNLAEYKEKYCSDNETIKSDPNTKLDKDIDDNINPHNNLHDYGFNKIGKYLSVDGDYECRYSVERKDRCSLVYAFVVDNEVKYLGKSIQGYVRPLSYLSNKVMKDVRDGITQTLDDGFTVEIYTKNTGLKIEKDGLEIDFSEGYEHALISKFKPAWNNHIR